jgi:hypothetical protein
MPLKPARAQANGAQSNSFATPETSNGSDPPGKKGAPDAAKQSGANSYLLKDTSYSPPGGAQPQSRNGSRVLLDERPLVLLPSLAKAVGVDGAIVLQQLHYYLGNSKCGREHEGQCWIFNTYEQWQAHDFPFWPLRTLRRIFRRLEKQHVIVPCQPEGRANRRKYYRIDYGQLESLVARARAEAAKMDASKRPKWTLPLTQTTTNRAWGDGKPGVLVSLNVKRKPKGEKPDGRAKPRQAFSGSSFPYPQSVEEITGALQAKGIKIPPWHVQRFYADMQRTRWTTGAASRCAIGWPRC